MSSLLADLYLFFSQRRLVVFFATLVAIVVSVIAFANLNLSENIESMLPDNKSDAALNFRLLQQTPFSRKVVINLKEESHGTENDLIEVVDRLAAAMTRPFFTHVVSGTKASLNLDFLLWLINAYPNLFTETDIDEFQNKLTPVNVRQKGFEFRRIVQHILGIRRL